MGGERSVSVSNTVVSPGESCGERLPVPVMPVCRADCKVMCAEGTRHIDPEFRRRSKCADYTPWFGENREIVYKITVSTRRRWLWRTRLQLFSKKWNEIGLSLGVAWSL